ncbi:type II toxin-antitoxin system Phd/YefM family antitoxin [uncultured Algibacter sp.]|uniref:type II toxin-antitoxin system Phd/YefM family antitoxin n=1 Tax=uncultured Algibacter sp. TaxID=298659 RepID=UPI002635991E|nr:type II toxin-antitoxin system Phd/YefM family antitoxin [uncultured Algibacter sp.]
MKTITSTSLRGRLKYYLDLVSESYVTIMIPRTKDEEAIVMMPLSEYNSLTETDYLLRTDANKNTLLESIEQAEKGEVTVVDI